MRITVIIPAINEAAHITAAVQSARAAGTDEILVVDGGSTDGTAALVGDARLLHSLPGRAIQQNAGARAAQGDALLFLHADCRLAPAALIQVRSALEHNGAIWGALRQRIDAPGVAFRALEWGNAWRVRWRHLVYGDQGLWLRRETFERVGGFAEVPLLEDLLLSQQLRRIAPPVLLPGPLLVSPRRWQRHGIVRQTLRNWSILLAHARGASPQELAERYRRHDR